MEQSSKKNTICKMKKYPSVAILTMYQTNRKISDWLFQTIILKYIQLGIAVKKAKWVIPDDSYNIHRSY